MQYSSPCVVRPPTHRTSFPALPRLFHILSHDCAHRKTKSRAMITHRPAGSWPCECFWVLVLVHACALRWLACLHAHCFLIAPLGAGDSKTQTCRDEEGDILVLGSFLYKGRNWPSGLNSQFFVSLAPFRLLPPLFLFLFLSKQSYTTQRPSHSCILSFTTS